MDDGRDKLHRDAEQLRKGTSTGFEIFRYPPTALPPMPSWDAFGMVAPAGDESRNHDTPAPAESHSAGGAGGGIGADVRLADETRRSFEAGREQGFQAGRAAERDSIASSMKAKDAARVEYAAHLVESFNAERVRFFTAVEHEVVKLALAVAARILRREAQMDPLLLTGAVRVALGQLSASTQVRLRVPAADLELWTDTIALVPRLALKPTVVAGEGMRLGDCVMETEMGTVDLGVRSQLGEIERGFFDRAGPNPAAAAATETAEDMSE